jgi:hypothetical protein
MIAAISKNRSSEKDACLDFAQLKETSLWIYVQRIEKQK